MPKFTYEENDPHCTRCGSYEYYIEDHIAKCAECDTQIVFETLEPVHQKGKKIKKARFRE